jgi:hypothetical protein
MEKIHLSLNKTCSHISHFTFHHTGPSAGEEKLIFFKYDEARCVAARQIGPTPLNFARHINAQNEREMSAEIKGHKWRNATSHKAKTVIQ